MLLKNNKLRLKPDIYYVWCGGCCDYAHRRRCSGGAYIMQYNDKDIETYVVTDDHTTEFRMILSVMIHAMANLPQGSDIGFLSNVTYIQQNFDKEPSNKSANADLIRDCISKKKIHNSVQLKSSPSINMLYCLKRMKWLVRQ